MTKTRFRRYCNRFKQLLQLLAPKDTGNLAINAIKLVFEGDNRAVIYVDLSIAPYMPYTNEPWTAARWNGKPNPNEGWFDNAIPQILAQLNREFGGKTE